MLKNIIRKHKHDAQGILLRQYPDFVLKNSTCGTETPPVFVFHEVTEDYLEPLLHYLSLNGYSSLNAEDLFQRLHHGNKPKQNEVALTFDDGDQSLYSVAYPLLKKYGLTGISFIIPGWIGRAVTIGNSTRSHHSYCTWAEIQEMHASRVIDFQAHSMNHCSIFISPKIQTFVSPQTDFSHYVIECLSISENGQNYIFPQDLKLGTPIYESAFRLQNFPKYYDSQELRHSCMAYVAERGGVDFFKRKTWKKQLLNHAETLSKNKDQIHKFESTEETEDAIRIEFRNTKRIIEAKLKGKIIRHFCFPNFAGSPLAIKIAKEEGYVTNFWGGFLPAYVKSDAMPIAITRLNSAYIYRLPGKGRSPLHRVLYQKYGGAITNRFLR